MPIPSTSRRHQEAEHDELFAGLECVPLHARTPNPIWRLARAENGLYLERDDVPFTELKGQIGTWQAGDAQLKAELAGELADLSELVRGLQAAEKRASTATIKQKWMQVRNYFEDMVNEIASELEKLTSKLKESRTKTPVETAATERGDLHTDAHEELFEPVAVTVSDIPVMIEVPAGGMRQGVDAKGEPWQMTDSFAYGEVPGTEGADGDPLDVILGTDPDPAEIYILEQLDEHGQFDEDKVMLGFDSAEAAEKAYDADYRNAPTRRGTTTTETAADFTEVLFSREDDLTAGLDDERNVRRGT